MELHELHVLQWQAGTQHHATAVTRAGMRGGAGEIDASIAAGRQDGGVGTEAMHLALRHVERDDTATLAVLHDEIDGEILDEELRGVLERLLVQRVQHRVTGAIRGCAGALCDAFAEVRSHAAERPLIDAPSFVRENGTP